MGLVAGNPTEWRLRKHNIPGKRTWFRYNPETGHIEVLEQWDNEAVLAQARMEREMAERSSPRSGFRPLCVIPNSERARAIREGWNEDDGAWRRWMNDIDNRYLRLTKKGHS